MSCRNASQNVAPAGELEPLLYLDEPLQRDICRRRVGFLLRARCRKYHSTADDLVVAVARDIVERSQRFADQFLAPLLRTPQSPQGLGKPGEPPGTGCG